MFDCDLECVFTSQMPTSKYVYVHELHVEFAP